MTIGIFDSGIGGLTTLKLILDKFSGNDALYFADNAHHPLGVKSDEELTMIVKSGINFLKDNSDIVVLACNTASTLKNLPDVKRLVPPYVDGALVLATEGTLRRLSFDSPIKCAHTPELATLVEEAADLCYEQKSTKYFDYLKGYLELKLSKFKNLRDIVLGCSHYLYLKRQIVDILGEVNLFDGNEKLLGDLSKTLSPVTGRLGKISFAFSGKNESKKYAYLLTKLLNDEI